MNLIETISKKTLLADGAMGTMLHARGIGFDKCFDELNLTNPVVVAEIHREYIEAGARLIITNTFSANRFKLSKHGLQGDVAEINRAGVELAKRVVSASYKDVLIAGDVGPLGVRIAPWQSQAGGARSVCGADPRFGWRRARFNRHRNDERLI